MNIKEQDREIFGYLLLIIGLIIMFYSIFSVIGVFTGGDVPIEILHAEKKEDTTDVETNTNSGNASMSEFDISKVFEPMFPMFNLLIWLMIAFFILAAGGRVARIGIQMLKATIPDVTIIKSDVKDINVKKNQTEKLEPEIKEKKRFFNRKKNM